MLNLPTGQFSQHVLLLHLFGTKKKEKKLCASEHSLGFQSFKRHEAIFAEKNPITPFFETFNSKLYTV